MRRFISILLIFILSTLYSSADVKAAPRADLLRSPGEIMSLINAYRAENGLPAYSQNSILMQTAQGQADYQASIESVTHEGPGGTRPRDRAYAAGYGGGEIVFVSEIIYGSTSAGPDTAVSWWKTSQIHNDTMLASTYQEIGAGVASANGRNYYVAVTGYVAGGTYVPETSSGDTETAGEPLVPAVVIIPVVVATPQAEGYIMHIIRSGQTLWTVAAVYQVPLEDILALNGLPENAVIYPGDEIIIRAASQTTATSTPSPTDATSTPRSTEVALAQPSATLAQLLSATNEVVAGQAQGEPSEQNAVIRIVIAIALISIAMVIVASFFINPKSSLLPEDDPDPFAPLN